MSSILSLENIVVKFGENTILDKIFLNIQPGTFIGLMGDNGSGKTSLLKLLAGEIKQSNGTVSYLENDISTTDIKERMRTGIVYIHQNPLIFPELKAWENFYLWNAALGNQGKIVDKESTITFLTKKLSMINFELPLEKTVSTLTETELQILEFCRFFLTEAKLVLIDETTSILNYHLSNRILEFLKTFTTRGGSVVFVSHRLEEVLKFSDETYVITKKHLKPYSNYDKDSDFRTVEPALYSNNQSPFLINKNSLIINCEPEKGLDAISITLRAGEIYGITGLDGLAFETIAQRLINCLKRKKRADGKSIVIGKDIGYLGKNRSTDWVFGGQTIGFNISITSDRKCFISKKNKIVNQIIESYNIRPSNEKKVVDELSGGNRLKTALARTLGLQSLIFLLDEPFTGIDANSKEAIMTIIKKESEVKQRTFIVISKDYRELIKFCNSILVINNVGGSCLLPMGEDNNADQQITKIL